MFRKFIIMCVLAIAGSACFADNQEYSLPQKESGYALYSLYFFSPDNPWHDYLIDGGEMPLALYTVKQHLITIDPALASLFEEEQRMNTVFLCFAAYANTHQDTVWDDLHTLLQTSLDSTEIFSSENEKEDVIEDLILAFEDYILVPYQTKIPELLEVVIKQIPWFLDGVPAYLSSYTQNHEQTEPADDIIVTEEVHPQEAALQITPECCPKKHPTTCKESLKKTWAEDIKPFLEQTKAKFRRFVEKVKESREFKKAKTEFDKIEREVRSFRKEAQEKTKQFFKKF